MSNWKVETIENQEENSEIKQENKSEKQSDNIVEETKEKKNDDLKNIESNLKEKSNIDLENIKEINVQPEKQIDGQSIQKASKVSPSIIKENEKKQEVNSINEKEKSTINSIDKQKKKEEEQIIKKQKGWISIFQIIIFRRKSRNRKSKKQRTIHKTKRIIKKRINSTMQKINYFF